MTLTYRPCAGLAHHRQVLPLVPVPEEYQDAFRAVVQDDLELLNLALDRSDVVLCSGGLVVLSHTRCV